MATRTNINISDKTNGGRALSQAEIAANRRRLAAVIAHAEPGRAIVAPPGVADLKDVGIEARKPNEEIFTMITDIDVTEAPGGSEVQPEAVAPPSKKGRKAKRLPEEQVREMHARYMELGSLRQTAKEYGRNAGYLGRQFEALGLPVSAHGGNRRGANSKRLRTAPAQARATKAKKEPMPKSAPQFSDEAIRDIFTDWTQCGGPLLGVATRYRIDQNILRKRFRALGLEDTGVRIPYERPSVATLPLNGTGKHAAAAREMVAEAKNGWADAFRSVEEMGQSVGAPTPPKPEKTAVLPIVGYGMLHDMIDLLPVHGRWTAEERGLWLDAFTALVKLYTREARP